MLKMNKTMKASEAQANRSSNAIGGKLAKGMKLLGVAAAAGAAYGLYKAVDAGASFEKQMDELGAVTGARTKDMKKFEKQALSLGEATQYTANEVAKAQTELAKGGLSANQINGGALKASLSLAAAGSLELATAAETTVNAMKLFGLQGKDTGQIADMLATAANRTTADVSDFAMALKQGGSVAKLAGLNFNNTVTILEALAEAGIKNSDAGTSLKTSLIQLLKPSEKQAKLTKELGIEWIKQNGTIKTAAGLSQEVRRATDGMTKAERAKTLATLAGTDGVRTLNALYDAGPGKLRNLEAANKKQGTAQDIARQKMDNLKGDVEQLTGALETQGIKLYKVLAPSLRTAAQWATRFVQNITKLNIQELAAKLGIGKQELKKFELAAHNAGEIFKKYLLPIIKTVIGVILRLLQDFAQAVRGVVRIITGILTGDFGEAWRGVKDIFHAGVDGALAIVKGITKPMRMAAVAIGDALSGPIDAAANVVFAVINAVIDALNAIPGVDIGHVGGESHAKSTSKGGLGKPRGRHRKARGGPINIGAPAGDTVPAMLERGEYVLNKKAVAAVGKGQLDSLNFKHAPRFAGGGVVPGLNLGSLVGDTLGTAGEIATAPVRIPAQLAFDAVKGAAGIVSHFPSGDEIPEPFAGVGPWAVEQAKNWVTGWFKDHPSKAKGPGGTKGPRGVGSYKGVPMANWVIESLEYAASKGAAPQPTSGYRSHAYNVSQGRNYFSEHEKTQYPGGAVDFGGYTTGLAAKMSVVNATKDFKYPLLAPIGFRDDGHASGTGHQKGGLIGSLLQKLASGGAVVKTAGTILGRHALDLASAAGILGNSYGESGWDTEAMEPGTDNGGMFGFTAGEKSLASLRAFAEKQGKPWGDTATQVQFMLTTLPTSMRSAMNNMSTIDDTTSYFMHEWERPASYASLPTRIAAGKKAAAMLKGGDFTSSGKASTEHTYKEDVPAIYRGCKTGSLSFGSTPKNLPGIEKELAKRRSEVKKYRAAADYAKSKDNRPGVAQALQQNVTALEGWIRELERARAAARREAAKRRITARFGKQLGQLTGFDKLIALKERAFNEQQQYVGQLVDKEPVLQELAANLPNAQREAIEGQHVADTIRYVWTKEQPAFQALLGDAGSWRNTILSAQQKAAGRWQGSATLGGLEGGWEDRIFSTAKQINQINTFGDKTAGDVRGWRVKHPKEKLPEWLQAAVKKTREDAAKLPILKFTERELRKVLGEGQGEFYPGKSRIGSNPTPPLAGTGALEEALESVQGIHWPDQHEKLSTLPAMRTAGQFGGLIWDVEGQMEELGLKIRGASSEGSGSGGSENEGSSARAEFLEEQLRQANQRNLVFERQKPIIDNFAGMFAKGGSIPAGMWGIAGEAGPEIVQGPATVIPTGGGTGNISLQVYVSPNGEVDAYLNGEQVKQVETIMDKRNRKQGRGAQTVGARIAGKGA
jgi:TP901 family phage tail tape measure protein